MSEENIRTNENGVTTAVPTDAPVPAAPATPVASAAPAAPATSAASAPAEQPASACTAAPTYASADASAALRRASDASPYEEREREKERRRGAVRAAAKGVSPLVLIPASFLLGVLICELLLRTSTPGVGFTLSIICAFALYTTLVIKRDRQRLRGALVCAVPLALLTGSFAFSASFSGRGLMLLATAGLIMLTTAMLSGSTATAELFTPGTLRDAVYANTIAPLSSIGASFGGLFAEGRAQTEEGEKPGRGIGKVLIGLLIAAPLVLILLVAMASADAMFSEFIDNIFEWLRKQDINVGRIFGDIVFGALFCVFAVPLVLSLRAGYVKPRQARPAGMRIDPIIAATVAYCVAAVYVLFVAVQISYFFPVSISYYFEKYDFTQRLTLPENMTWAEYARSGFFELSGIIIASFAAIAFLMAFCRRSEKNDIPGYLKAALTVIAACNIIMALSAVMRMGLYTIWCGLTAKRIGVLMIIAVIALLLAAVIIRLWRHRFPLVRVAAIAAVCALVCFGCMNVERICAEVNVSRHIEQGTSIDMCYIGNLSYAAAPAVERLMRESPDEDIRAAAAGILAKYYYMGAGCVENGTHAAPLKNAELGELTLDHLWAYNACLDENGKLWVTKEMLEDYGRYADWQDYVTDYQRWNDEDCTVTLEQYNAVENAHWSYNDYCGW